MFVDGKVVMIVGAGPGLGATLARRCAEDGADLVLAARTPSTLERIADGDPRAAAHACSQYRPMCPTATRCARSSSRPSPSTGASTCS